jgi:5'-nucleotidase
MHVLLTNDDGIHAPGLASAYEAARQLPGVSQISIVAPAQEQSMCGHRITTHAELEVTELSPGRWAVAGTPADCVRIGLFALGLKPNWVLSGINQGGNLGQDIVISGTCAAAREAVYHGVRGMAFSHYLKRDLALDWARAGSWMRDCFLELAALPQEAGHFWCVNFPHHAAGTMELPARKRCQPARAPLPVAFRQTDTGRFLYQARYADRGSEPGSDVAVCFSGEISVCSVCL